LEHRVSNLHLIRAVPPALRQWKAAVKSRNNSGNRLLASLPPKDRLHLFASCEKVDMKVDDVLVEAAAQLQFVHFPMTGIASQMSTTNQGMRLEIVQIGNDGMIGSEVALGIGEAPTKWLVRGAGSGDEVRKVTATIALH
jgi:hypothetical protein